MTTSRSPPCHHRGRDQHAHERTNDTNDQEPRVFLKLGCYGRPSARQIERRTSERVDDDASDEACNRVGEEDEWQREHDASAL